MVISSSPTRLQEVLCSRCTDRGGGRRCRSAPGPRLGGPQAARTPASETGARGRAPSPPDAVLLPGSRGRRWGRGHGQRRWAGQPPQPHPLPPADALGTHWTLRTPTRKPNWETKAGRRGQTLTDVVGGSGQAARRGPQRGRGRGREWARPAHAAVARATAPSRRGLLGHCPGHTGRVIHQMAVCCVSQLSGAE